MKAYLKKQISEMLFRREIYVKLYVGEKLYKELPYDKIQPGMCIIEGASLLDDGHVLMFPIIPFSREDSVIIETKENCEKLYRFLTRKEGCNENGFKE